MTAPSVHAALSLHVGAQLVAVDELDEVIVLTFRPVGRRSRRHVALAHGADGWSAYEVREGSRLMSRIEANKFRRLPTEGRAS